MSENKAKLIALISAIEEENIIDYFYTFSGLKVYGKANFYIQGRKSGAGETPQ